MRPLALLLLVGLALAASDCARSRGPRGDPRHGVEIVSDREVAEFHASAEAFYRRLTNRRVNTYATFRDRVLREYFRSEQAYSDYYADISQALASADFEKNRPLSAEIREFVFEEPGRARVRVRWVGLDGRPLRPGKVTLDREDRWERAEGRWWVVPGRL